MPFFRRSPAIQDLIYRPLEAADMARVKLLIEQTAWSSVGLPPEEYPLALNDQLSMVAELDGKIWAVALANWAMYPAAWIRVIALQNTLRPADAAGPLVARMESQAAARGARTLRMMSDERDASWLRPLMLRAGYGVEVEVIGYEKRTLFVPDWGNAQVAIRPALPADVPAIATVDAAAFTPEWVKNAGILDSVFPIAPCYLVAELDGAVVGYAFATTHHGGIVAHLVRIAVLPSFQGQGLGVRLLAEVVEWCRRHEVQVLSLNTQASNHHAQRLYEWFGFLRNGERQVVLVKSIAAALGSSALGARTESSPKGPPAAN